MADEDNCAKNNAAQTSTDHVNEYTAENAGEYVWGRIPDVEIHVLAVGESHGGHQVSLDAGRTIEDEVGTASEDADTEDDEPLKGDILFADVHRSTEELMTQSPSEL